jgi:thiol-disulfide isomerase/thioredoxin
MISMSGLHQLVQGWRLVVILGAVVALVACTTAPIGPATPAGDVEPAPTEPAAEEESAAEAVTPTEKPATAEVAPVAEPAAATAPVDAPISPEPALTIEQMRILQSLESSGPPPELTNEIWFNSEPLQLADLRGQVVIVEFWTYGCINCQNVLPELKAWHEKYADEGLTIIGVHTPEFTFEKDLNNVQQALIDYVVTYPVAIDNDKVTWRAYHNRYWPAMYFIDKAGNVRHLKIGEGRMAEAEKVLQALLAEPL